MNAADVMFVVVSNFNVVPVSRAEGDATDHKLRGMDVSWWEDGAVGTGETKTEALEVTRGLSVYVFSLLCPPFFIFLFFIFIFLFYFIFFFFGSRTVSLG